MATIPLIWMVILFLTLATTADDFFCPSLVVISKVLKLSQNVAGVTFLAFGNGAPDIFSSIAGMNQMRPELVIGALLGAGIFVSCVVVGAILLVTPFKMMERPFLRDVIFYLAAVFWTYYLLYTEVITFYHSLGFIALYIVYIIVVLLGHHIYQKYIKPRTVTSALRANAVVVVIAVGNSDGAVNIEDHNQNEVVPWGGPPIIKHWTNDEDEAVGDHSSIENEVSINRRNSESSASGYSEVTEGTPLLGSTEHHPSTEFWNFLCALFPIDWASWPNMAWYKKVLAVVKAPLVFLLKLTIPIVKNEEKPLHNWCRSLNTLHCVTTPVFVIFAIQEGFVTWGGPPLWSMVLAGGLCIAVLVWLTSTSNHPPCYHNAFAFLGFAASVVWIYFIANEIVNILKTIGVVAHLSDAILGLTVLAWGNSVGDLIADLSIARAGSPRMGVSACFGGPLFNLLLGIGIPFSLLTFEQKTKSIRIIYQKSTTILSAFLGASLLSSLIIIPLMKFQTKRSYGFYLIVLYVVFIVLSILNELQII